jgi:hypothetical protein
MPEVWNWRKLFPGATSATTYTKTHLDTIYLSYRNVQRNDTANPLQFVTRRHFYRFNTGIYFGEKSFADIQYVDVLGGNPE